MNGNIYIFLLYSLNTEHEEINHEGYHC